MGNSENPSNKQSDCVKNFLNYGYKAIQKNLCFASCSFYLFIERMELIEVPLYYFCLGIAITLSLWR